MRKLVAGAFLVAIACVACGGTGSSDGDGPLVVYSGRSEELVGPLIEQFETESGIDVEIRYADSSELAATLLAEGEETAADVFFAQDPASLGAAAELMAPLPDETLDLVDPRFHDRDGRWIGTSGRVRVVVHNTDTDLPLPRDDR